MSGCGLQSSPSPWPAASIAYHTDPSGDALNVLGMFSDSKQPLSLIGGWPILSPSLTSSMGSRLAWRVRLAPSVLMCQHLQLGWLATGVPPPPPPGYPPPL